LREQEHMNTSLTNISTNYVTVNALAVEVY